MKRNRPGAKPDKFSAVLFGVALFVLAAVSPGRAEPFSPTFQQRALLSEFAGDGRVALIYHVRIADSSAFDAWQKSVREQVEQVGGRRVYAGQTDPVAWEGRQVDVVWIDELPNAAAALAALEQATRTSTGAADGLSVLAIDPVPSIVPAMLRRAAVIAHFVAPLDATPSEEGGGEPEMLNPAIWPNSEAMRFAREQDPLRSFFMYNLNKVRERAAYDRPIEEDPDVSGEEAYRRYGALMGVLRRGGYPAFMGSVVGHVAGMEDELLADDWTQFILVYYPERRRFFSMIGSDAYAARLHHRDAALERASLRFTTPWPEFDPQVPPANDDE